MIQLSIQNTKSPENPAIKAVSAGSNGDFAAHLPAKAAEPATATGKALPPTGKLLPGQLPVSGKNLPGALSTSSEHIEISSPPLAKELQLSGDTLKPAPHLQAAALPTSVATLASATALTKSAAIAPVVQDETADEAVPKNGVSTDALSAKTVADAAADAMKYADTAKTLVRNAQSEPQPQAESENAGNVAKAITAAAEDDASRKAKAPVATASFEARNSGTTSVDARRGQIATAANGEPAAAAEQTEPNALATPKAQDAKIGMDAPVTTVSAEDNAGEDENKPADAPVVARSDDNDADQKITAVLPQAPLSVLGTEGGLVEQPSLDQRARSGSTAPEIRAQLAAAPAIPGDVAEQPQKLATGAAASNQTAELRAGVLPSAQTADILADAEQGGEEPSRSGLELRFAVNSERKGARTAEVKADIRADKVADAAKSAGQQISGTASVQQVGTQSQSITATPIVSADGATAVSGGTTTTASFAGQQQGVRPHEFTALVDRLIEARETGRNGAVNVSVMNSDFGKVSLRFGQDNGNLTVSMANQDPEFARAVSAATQADSTFSQEQSSQNARRDDGAMSAGSQNRGAAGGQASAGTDGGEKDRQNIASKSNGERNGTTAETPPDKGNGRMAGILA